MKYFLILLVCSVLLFDERKFVAAADETYTKILAEFFKVAEKAEWESFVKPELKAKKTAEWAAASKLVTFDSSIVATKLGTSASQTDWNPFFDLINPQLNPQLSRLSTVVYKPFTNIPFHASYAKFGPVLRTYEQQGVAKVFDDLKVLADPNTPIENHSVYVNWRNMNPKNLAHIKKVKSCLAHLATKQNDVNQELTTQFQILYASKNEIAKIQKEVLEKAVKIQDPKERETVESANKRIAEGKPIEDEEALGTKYMNERVVKLNSKLPEYSNAARKFKENIGKFSNYRRRILQFFHNKTGTPIKRVTVQGQGVDCPDLDK